MTVESLFLDILKDLTASMAFQWLCGSLFSDSINHFYFTLFECSSYSTTSFFFSFLSSSFLSSNVFEVFIIQIRLTLLIFSIFQGWEVLYFIDNINNTDNTMLFLLISLFLLYCFFPSFFILVHRLWKNKQLKKDYSCFWWIS